MAVLTAKSVREIIGHAEKDLVTQLVDTGASNADLLAALAWLDEDDQLSAEGAPPPTGRVAELCRILDAARVPPEDAPRD